MVPERSEHCIRVYTRNIAGVTAAPGFKITVFIYTILSDFGVYTVSRIYTILEDFGGVYTVFFRNFELHYMILLQNLVYIQ